MQAPKNIPTSQCIPSIYQGSKVWGIIIAFSCIWSIFPWSDWFILHFLAPPKKKRLICHAIASSSASGAGGDLAWCFVGLHPGSSWCQINQRLVWHCFGGEICGDIIPKIYPLQFFFTPVVSLQNKLIVGSFDLHKAKLGTPVFMFALFDFKCPQSYLVSWNCISLLCSGPRVSRLFCPRIAPFATFTQEIAMLHFCLFFELRKCGSSLFFCEIYGLFGWFNSSLKMLFLHWNYQAMLDFSNVCAELFVFHTIDDT